MTASFRPNSIEFQKTIDKDVRSTNGIYFTPKKVRDILYTELDKLNIINPQRILEPSFGSGEFIFDLIEKYSSSNIVGVEKNSGLFDNVSSQTSKCILKCMDFLDYSSKQKHDLIIGNPPYFVLKNPSKDIKQKFSKQCNSGRLNMCILFLYKCLEYHLQDDGFLAFILPTSLYNSLYYQSMRNYIYKYTTIHYLSNLDKPGFYDTNQNTMLMILQKKKLNDHFIYKSLNNSIFISPYYKDLTELTQNNVNMNSLHMGTKIGNIVWNQIKTKLTDDDSQTLLIYPSNIKNCKFQLNTSNKNTSKKQYVSKDKIDKETINGPVILITRGYGNSVCFDSVLIHHQNFFAENHIVVIYPKNKDGTKYFPQILNSLQSEKTKRFIHLFLGNGSLSVKDLEYTIPIF
jgi:adenine-specific DNA-methyltransferase